jgi:tetratricopeptide (TPR) repeat protein
VLVKQLNAVENAKTPFHELVKDKHDSTVFRDQIELLSAFQAEVRAIHMLPDRDERIQQVKALIERSKQSLELRDVAFELLTLVRDNLSWEAMIDYIDCLPPAIHDDDFVREQRLLAQSKLGDHARAIAGLKELIQLKGQSPERLGLLGGRYKKLWLQAHRERLERGDALASLQEEAYLEDAIEHYRQGANLDLNEYYCVCNLPALLRERGGPGDEEDAAFFDRLTKVASQRKIDRREDDGWARAALLGAAFREGDVAEVARLAREVVREGPATWQLESTLTDIDKIVSDLPPSSSREQLSQIRDQLAAMIPPPAR